jgi:S1-C subfamily serine protease
MTRTRLIWLLAGVCGSMLVNAIVGAAAPQTVMKMVTIGGDDTDGTAMIAELGALIFEKDSVLTVEHVMEAANRPKAYQQVDLKKSDVILMVNGKRARSADEFSMILDSLPVGGDIKLGIRRDKGMQIVSFKKAAPEDLPQIQMVTQTMPGGNETGSEGGPKVTTVTRTEGGAGSDGRLAVLIGSGLIFKQDGDAVVVAATMPHAKEALGKVEVNEGDRILKIQDKEVTGPAMLQELYDAIAVGDSVTLVMARDGKEFTASFAKSEAPENIMIEKR